MKLFFKSAVVALLLLAIAAALAGSGIAPSAYNLIKNNGSAIHARTVINFPLGGCVDNAATTPPQSDCSFALPNGNFACTFTSQTSVVCTHNLGTTNVIVDVYDNGTPPLLILPTSVQLTSTNVVTVTFASSTSGTVVVSGGPGGGGGGGGGGGSVPTMGWTVANLVASQGTFSNFSSTIATLGAEAVGTTNFAMAYQPTPGATYTVIATISTNPASPTRDTEIFGFGVTDGTKFEDIEMLFENSSNPGEVALRVLTGTAFSGGTYNVLTGPTISLVPSTATFKVQDDGTHRTWSYYSNGAFVQFYQEASHTFLTETGVGLTILNSTTLAPCVATNSVITWAATSP